MRLKQPFAVFVAVYEAGRALKEFGSKNSICQRKFESLTSNGFLKITITTITTRVLLANDCEWQKDLIQSRARQGASLGHSPWAFTKTMVLS